ncbi:MAG: hypothetical protein RL693_1555 [Verrucomicrobiota bacterium]
MKITSILSVLALSASLSFAADGDKPKKPPGEGDKPRPNPEEIFKHLDTNNDKSISKEEFLAGPKAKENPEKAKEIFAHKDKDGDGKLSMQEFAAHPERPPGKKPEKKE